ncbi:unnamed protein product [Calicophoron daubneyi]|uniref:EF-hand domain-containing protein n=1 Tax=Calicophoron daubneyi TaxID=300641 RepID=A0AAV2TDN6_CALDB
MATDLPVNEEKVQHLRDLFNKFDKNNDGYINMQELRLITRHLRMTNSLEEAKELMGEADTNADGVIDFGEFVRLIIPLKIFIMAPFRIPF